MLRSAQVDGHIDQAQHGAGEEECHREVRREDGHEQVRPKDGHEEECVAQDECKVATQHDDHGHEDGGDVRDVHQQLLRGVVLCGSGRE